MAYCSNCGHLLPDGANFCENCGRQVNRSSSENSKYRQEYAGKLIKCPCCGEALKSFVSVCPACGYELRGASASDAIEKFSIKLENASSKSEKTEIINAYPIPNTKEDILEFMILAVSNSNNEPDYDILRAWKAKMDQAYQKAKIVFTDKSEFSRCQEKYDQFEANYKKEKKSKIKIQKDHSLSELMSVMPQIIIVTTWFISLFVLLPFCRINLDNVDTNGSQLLIMLDLLLGAIIIPKAFYCGSVLPKLITTVGYLLTIIFLLPLCKTCVDDAGFSPFMLILFVDGISIIIVLRKGSKKSKQYTGEKAQISGSSALTIVFAFIIILLVVYGLGTLKIMPELKQQQSSEIPTIDRDTEAEASKGIYTYEIRKYVGKNAASVGEEYGDDLVDEYGAGELKIIFVTEDGMLLSIDDTETLKKYIVTGQNIPPKTALSVIHERDSKGKPYNSLVSYQSYDEILLFASPIGEPPYEPTFTRISPTLDRHIYHIRDYIGRNAASFGKYYGNDRVDEYGEAELKITFTDENGYYVDSNNEDDLKQYIITNQDIDPNHELKIEYETDSKGKEYDNLVKYQNYDMITLTVKKLDESLIESMPDLSTQSVDKNTQDYKELTIKYRVLKSGKAEISGYSGDGNHATIGYKIDGYDISGIADSAFKNCTSLEAISFLADIEKIGDSSFKGCISLKEISIPYKTKSIGNHAFEGCTNLEKIILWGDPVIGEYAFAGCAALPSISIGYNTESVGAHAFDGCTALSEVTIWNKNTIIGKDAFANCPNINRPIQE